MVIVRILVRIMNAFCYVRCVFVCVDFTRHVCFGVIFVWNLIQNNMRLLHYKREKLYRTEIYAWLCVNVLIN